MTRRSLAAGLLVATLAAGVSCTGVASPALTVYAASSLADAFEALAPAFEAQSGGRIRASYAASSTLARQIEAGAEADVFVSADQAWMDYLESRRHIIGETRVNVLANRLVLVVPSDRPAALSLTRGFDLAGLLGKGRLATGDPAHVPAGRYARQALTALGVWDVARPKLAAADSVRAALALVERGEVPAAVVYESDALASGRVCVAGVFPASTHDAIVYAAAVVARRDRPLARRYLAFLQSPGAAATFSRYHFVVKPQ